MGNCGSSESEVKSKKAVAKPAYPPNFGKRTDLDPKDFMFCKMNGEALVKAPGKIDGQQFLVEDCEDSDVYLLDHIASMNVDSCKKCRIVTGPVAGSVFIRDCSDCIVVIACQQLRLRNCRNLSK